MLILYQLRLDLGSPIFLSSVSPVKELRGKRLSFHDFYFKVADIVVLFADDITLFASHSDPHLAQSAVGELLTIASSWFKGNKLVTQ